MFSFCGLTYTLQGSDVRLNIFVCVCESIPLPTASHSGRGVEGRPPESVWPADEGPCHVLRSGPPPGQRHAGVRLAYRHAGWGAHRQGHYSTGVCVFDW